MDKSWRSAQALDNFLKHHWLGSVQATARGKWYNLGTLYNRDATHLSVFTDEWKKERGRWRSRKRIPETVKATRKIKVKVNCNIRRRQTYGSIIHSVSAGWRWVFNATLQSLYSREINQATIVRETGWASRSVRTGAESLPHRGSNPKTCVVDL